MNDCVSIIVPIYNVEKYVEKCLLSLVNQTYKRIIIYAVIDGSMDNSIAIVKKYAGMDNRIKCIEKENGGYGSVLEYAISRINTKYFMICDPDDWLEKNAVATLISTAKEENMDIVAADRYNVFSSGDNARIVAKCNDGFEFVRSGVVYTKNIGIMAMLNCSPHSKIYRTSLVRDIKFPKKTSYTDFLLFMVIVSRARRGIYINKVLSDYLIDREGNTMTTYNTKSVLDQKKVFDETVKYISLDDAKNKYLHYKLYYQCRYVFISELANVKKIDNELIRRSMSGLDEINRKYVYNCLQETHAKRVNFLVAMLLFNKKTRIAISKMLIMKKRRWL